MTSLLCSIISCGDVTPVHNLPNIFKVFGTRIHVVQVICVFPDIDSKQWGHRGQGVLVRHSSNVERSTFSVVSKPSPSRSLNSCRFCIEDLDEIFHRSPFSFNGCSKVSGWTFSTSSRSRGKVLPKNGVVNVTTPIEFDCSLKCDHLGNIILCLCSSVAFKCGVQIIDVGGVVFGVMQFHNFRTHYGLQRGVIVLEIRKAGSRGECPASLGTSES
mmetsp:Transcript_2332/g.3349  ORF Transcript_2332/g.3349 Transcript_2332/m.3349 type:complete len:215 (+) Transcript_2332:113-757(+)